MPLLCACLKRSSWPLAAVSRTFSKQRAPGLLFRAQSADPDHRAARPAARAGRCRAL